MLTVTRHQSADAFLIAARPLLMTAEAENNLILGVTEGLARMPEAVSRPYLATVAANEALAAAVYFSPFKLLLTRASRDAIRALARDAFEVVPTAQGVTGPAQSAEDFAGEWSRLAGVPAKRATRMRIHQATQLREVGFPTPAGGLRSAVATDRDLLTAWTDRFAVEAGLSEPVDSKTVVENGIRRGRLYVWDDAGPKSMAAWAGKTPNGVRISFVFTPVEERRKGYATACVTALTAQQLEQGNRFCWLYTDLLHGNPSGIFEKIGYTPVSDVTEYEFGGANLPGTGETRA